MLDAAHLDPLRVLIGCGDHCEIRPVPGWPSYYATACGKIVSTHRRKPISMKRRPHRGGYALVTLRDGGRSETTTFHRVIAMAFIPNPDGLPCVRHIDADKQNNAVSNLAWGTYGDNEADKVPLGLRRYGTAKMKLNREARDKILKEAKLGATRKELADKFGVNRSTITRLINGNTWLNRKWPMAEKAALR